MICPQCGSQVEGNFCAQCGTRLSAAPPFVACSSGQHRLPIPRTRRHPVSCLPGKDPFAEKEVKVHLGLSHELEFVCEQCGSVFIERGGSPAHLELAKTGKEPDIPGWKSYAHKNLSIGEWDPHRPGGRLRS